jgi:metal-sulfur cluster biosynthetic enzyme
VAAEPSPLAVRDRLDEIVDPCSEARGTDISIVEMGLLKRIEIDDGAVRIELRITSPSCMMVGYFIEQANERVGSLPGVESVTLETDAGLSWNDGLLSEDAKKRRERHQRALAERYRRERDAKPVPTAAVSSKESTTGR